MTLSTHHRVCWLEWEPWGEDRIKGLNHQMSSLGCALAEALFLNRTLLLPARICIDIAHQQRVANGIPLEADARCAHRNDEMGWTSRRARLTQAVSVPIEDLLDLRLLSALVPIAVLQLPRAPGDWVPGFVPPPPHRIARVDRRWSSNRVAAELPCGHPRATLVQRRVSSFWFRPCSYRIVDGSALMGRVASALGLRVRQLPPPSQLLTHFMRSGLFYSSAVKAAAVHLRRSIGKPYAAIHVRRSDP